MSRQHGEAVEPGLPPLRSSPGGTGPASRSASGVARQPPPPAAPEAIAAAYRPWSTSRPAAEVAAVAAREPGAEGRQEEEEALSPVSTTREALSSVSMMKRETVSNAETGAAADRHRAAAVATTTTTSASAYDHQAAADRAAAAEAAADRAAAAEAAKEAASRATVADEAMNLLRSSWSGQTAALLAPTAPALLQAVHDPAEEALDSDEHNVLADTQNRLKAIKLTKAVPSDSGKCSGVALLLDELRLGIATNRGEQALNFVSIE